MKASGADADIEGDTVEIMAKEEENLIRSASPGLGDGINTPKKNPGMLTKFKNFEESYLKPLFGAALY